MNNKPLDIPGARPVAQVIEFAAQADRARAAGLADEHLVTLMLARRALADPAAGAFDQLLLARLRAHLRG